MWGADLHCCKKKFKPFTITIKTTTTVNGKTTTSIQVERQFGCAHHHELRKKVIKKHGERKGWQPFGVWSQKKAELRAKEVWEEEQKKLAAVKGGRKKASKVAQELDIYDDDYEDCSKDKKKGGKVSGRAWSSQRMSE